MIDHYINFVLIIKILSKGQNRKLILVNVI